MAGYNGPRHVLNTLPAGAGGVRKGQIVKKSGSNIVACSAQGEEMIGVALNDYAEGKKVSVCVAGECDVEVDDAAIAIGSWLTTKATGVAEVAATGDRILGMALEPGAVAVSGQYAYRRVVVELFKRTSA